MFGLQEIKVLSRSHCGPHIHCRQGQSLDSGGEEEREADRRKGKQCRIEILSSFFFGIVFRQTERVVSSRPLRRGEVDAERAKCRFFICGESRRERVSDTLHYSSSKVEEELIKTNSIMHLYLSTPWASLIHLPERIYIQRCTLQCRKAWNEGERQKRITKNGSLCR